MLTPGGWRRRPQWQRQPHQLRGNCADAASAAATALAVPVRSAPSFFFLFAYVTAETPRAPDAIKANPLWMNVRAQASDVDATDNLSKRTAAAGALVYVHSKLAR